MDTEKKIFKIVALIFFGIAIGCLVCGLLGVGQAEDFDEPTRLYVTAKLLNGRAKPSKKSMVEARFDRGDILEAWGWSEKHHWIEVTGGEMGTVWVCWEYVTERLDESTWYNATGSKVKIRKEPFGTVIGYLPKDKDIVVDRIVLGWGHFSKGWVDLSYFEEEF